MSDKPLKVVVKRSRWLRGEGCDESFLYRESDGRQCCLGFALRAAGHRRKDIVGVTSPMEIDTCKLPQLVQHVHFFVTSELMELNDDPSLSARERERRLRAVGRKAGLKFVFVP